MKNNKHIQSFVKFNENMNIHGDDGLDLSMELEYGFRTIDEDSELTAGDFLEECGVDLDTMSGFELVDILKQKEERFNLMDDEDFFNLYEEYKSLGSNDSSMKNHIIDRDDAIKLFSLEEDNLGPDDEYTDDEFEGFLNDYVGKTLWDYSKHRFPDDPHEQFRLAVDVLGE